jgi:hypothetical protein
LRIPHLTSEILTRLKNWPERRLAKNEFKLHRMQKLRAEGRGDIEINYWLPCIVNPIYLSRL